MARAPRLVIAAGGTGGHMFPAQALAEAMVQRGWQVMLSTDTRGARYTASFPSEVVIGTVSSATFARGGVLAKLVVPLRIAAGVAAATFSFASDRPTAVIGFGGYPSIPALSAAWLLRIPRLIHEQNGVLGRVNRIFARRVGKVACGTWPTPLPRGAAGVHVGNPVREAIREVASAAYQPAETGPLSVLVIGGSQGARVLSQIVPAALAALPGPLRARLQVTHQAREEDEAGVRAAYEGAGIDAEISAFFSDIPERMARAQLVISRAGASSVAELAAVGRPAILVPFAAAMDDHQTANARGLAEAGAAVVVSENALEPAALSEQIGAILADPARAARMAGAARDLGMPDATERLVALVEAETGRTEQRKGQGR